jgi:hypothetical protein
MLSDLAIGALILAGYIALVRYVLPKLGVPT